MAAPDKIVVDIDGDASFMMTQTELATAVQYRLPIKVLILNNDFQGMVKQWQDLFYDECVNWHFAVLISLRGPSLLGSYTALSSVKCCVRARAHACVCDDLQPKAPAP